MRVSSTVNYRNRAFYDFIYEIKSVIKQGRIFELEKEQRELVEGAMLIKQTYEQKLKMTKKLTCEKISSIQNQKDLQFNKLYDLIHR